MPALPLIPILTEDSDFREWQSQLMFLANSRQFLPAIEQPLADIVDMTDNVKKILNLRAKEALSLYVEKNLLRSVASNFKNDPSIDAFTVLSKLEAHFSIGDFRGKASAWRVLKDLENPSIISDPVLYTYQVMLAFDDIAANGLKIPAADQIAWICDGLRSTVSRMVPKTEDQVLLASH
ncbi:hypothetical protein BROUX41_002940 [Berkeleyomyces rouxiae]|uniref:uncharacterized protein n=1 Tax=Berkeleyomyces rouxiae TaxID=2035830 RepID=UPI003B76E094